ncbi:MAG: DUF1871 domain-containing protein [Lachnospiraceae bacterium]|nr:DUF1871 domain-containing protein [Lachnospiraceae bacterium]
MRDKIEKIINDWDPIGFFPMAPEDEYTDEISKIHEYIYSEKNQQLQFQQLQIRQIQALAETINTIFIKAFGKDVYDENPGQCMLVAKKILEQKRI